MDNSPEAHNTQEAIHRPNDGPGEGRPKCGCFSPFWEGKQNTHERQSVEQSLKDRPSRDCPSGNPSHIESSNTDTIVVAKKCLLTGAWYNCLLRGYARAWQTLRWVIIDNHCIEHGFHKVGVRERTEGAEGYCNPIWRINIPTNQKPQNSHGLNNQTNITHGENNGYCIWSKGWPCRTLMGQYVLGPVKVWYPSVISGGLGYCGCL